MLEAAHGLTFEGPNFAWLPCMKIQRPKKGKFGALLEGG
jgi:hypothetical protein